MRRRATGFSLLELMAVLILLSLLAAVTTATMVRTQREATWREVAGAIMQLEHETRGTSVALGVAMDIVIDTSEDRLTVAAVEDAGQGASGTQLSQQERDALRRVYRLPRGYDLQRVLYPLGEADGLGNGQVRLDAYGHSATYGAVLTGPDQETRVLLFAGLTGQPTVCASVDEAMALRAVAEGSRERLRGVVIEGGGDVETE